MSSAALSIDSMRRSYFAAYCKGEREPNVSDVDVIPAYGLQEFVKVYGSSIKAAQEDLTRLVIQMDGRPGFFVMIIYNS